MVRQSNAKSNAIRAPGWRVPLVRPGAAGRGSREKVNLLESRQAERDTSAPAAVTGATAGLHPLGLDRRRDALLYIPEACIGAQKVPLIVPFTAPAATHTAASSCFAGWRTGERFFCLRRHRAQRHGT